MPKVSIIVPVYGVEKYIERCARSLFEQTFEDIEYIFVNDCTKDNSIEVLETVMENYPNRMKQVKILHHEVNKGLPQARKTGILTATGEYLINFDSDDWVDTKTIEVLYNKAVQDVADIVIFDIYTTNGEHHTLKIGGAINLDKWELFEKMCQQKFPWSACNKLIKRDLFTDVIYPIYSYAEDMALVLQLVVKAEKISYVPCPLYYYYCNPQSITRTLTTNQILDNIEGRKHNNEIVFKTLSNILHFSKKRDIIDLLKWQTKKILWDAIRIDHLNFKEWKSLYSEINYSLFFNSFISLKDKVKHVLTSLGCYPR